MIPLPIAIRHEAELLRAARRRAIWAEVGLWMDRVVCIAFGVALGVAAVLVVRP